MVAYRAVPYSICVHGQICVVVKVHFLTALLTVLFQPIPYVILTPPPLFYLSADLVLSPSGWPRHCGSAWQPPRRRPLGHGSSPPEKGSAHSLKRACNQEGLTSRTFPMDRKYSMIGFVDCS